MTISHGALRSGSTAAATAGAALFLLSATLITPGYAQGPSTTPAAADTAAVRAAASPAPTPAAADTGAARASATPAPPAATTLVEAGPQGFTVRSADGAFRLRLQGVAQYDGRAFLADDADRSADGFDVRRLRTDIRGTVYSDFDFRINLEYAGNRVDVLDAYLEHRISPALQIRAGKFKSPVGLERLKSTTAVTFPERAFPTALVPNRDVGLQLQGAVGGSLLSWAAGIFNGAGDGSSGDGDSADSKDLVGRLFLHPFTRGPQPLRGLGVGISASVGDQEGSVSATGLPSLRTPIGRTGFVRFRADGTADGSAVLDGRRTRFSPQGYWYIGPVGLLGEYVRSTSEVRIAGEVSELAHSAWQLAGSWVLTGEPTAYRGVQPARDFDPTAGTWGAVEVATRVHRLEVDSDAFPRFVAPVGSAAAADGYSVGLNWYLNRLVSVHTAWERTTFAAIAEGTAPDAENVIITRFQVAF